MNYQPHLVVAPDREIFNITKKCPICKGTNIWLVKTLLNGEYLKTKIIRPEIFCKDCLSDFIINSINISSSYDYKFETKFSVVYHPDEIYEFPLKEKIKNWKSFYENKNKYILLKNI